MTHALPLLDLPATNSDDAGFGALETPRGCLPLIAMDVRGAVAGLFAQTSVRQTFCNAFDEPLEATYIFPLPDRAAATRFRMTVADRVIEGELKERGKAREEYDEAIEQGHRAAIAEEERSGVFTMRVGNILPGEEATVELDLVGPLEVCEDEATYRFPLVVAPRYTPGAPLDGPNVGDGAAPDTDEVPDASRVTPPVLLPGFPNPVRLSLEMELDAAGLWESLADVRSSLHTIVASQRGSSATVRLQPGERLNRDFILRFPIANESVRATLQCGPAAQAKPGAFALTLTPPKMSLVQPKPREVVFVLDRSGSMGGWKMVAARRALGRMIDTLLDQDRFTVIAFDDALETPGGNGKRARPQWAKRSAPAPDDSLRPGSNRERWQVLEWLGKIDARGGTEMRPALTFALECFSEATAGVERVLVLVTDGQVSGEDALLKSLRDAAGEHMPRIFALGIDQAVNAGFLRRLTDLGGGTCDLVESEKRLDEALDRVHRLIGQPVLTDVRLELLDFDGVKESLSPTRIAGLYAGRPLTIFGRHLSEKTAVKLRVHALDPAGQPWTADVTAQAAPPAVLLNLWGRAKVRELEDEYAACGSRNDNLAERIVAVSLESGVLSRFTAYVAVDRSEVVNAGGRQHKILQPVEVPAGWDDAVTMGGAMFCNSAPVALKRSRRAPNPISLHVRQRAEKLMRRAMPEDLSLGDDESEDLLEGMSGSNFGNIEPPPAATSLMDRFRGLFSRGSRKTVDWRKLESMLAEMSDALENLKQASAPSRAAFADLIDALAAVVGMLSHANHAASGELQALAEEGQQILSGWNLAGTAAPLQPRLSACLATLGQSLDKLRDPAQRKRKAFWKST